MRRVSVESKNGASLKLYFIENGAGSETFLAGHFFHVQEVGALALAGRARLALFLHAAVAAR